MLASRQRTAWFDDPALVQSFPVYFRLYATYNRLVARRAGGIVRGGSFLFRMMRRLVRIFGLQQEVRVRVGMRSAWVDLTDQRVLWVFDELRAASAEFGVMETLLAPGDTFIDVGANHGSFAILAAPLVGPTGLVVAVEPQPLLARLVERSLGETGVPFEVHSVALGANVGVVQLYVPDVGSGSTSRFRGYATGATRTIDVRLTRADELLAWSSYPGRVMVKLDIEGSELAFLDGAGGLMRARHPSVLFELNAESARAAGHTPDRLLTALSAMGYRFAELDAPATLVEAAQVPLAPQRNLLAIPVPP